QRKHNDLKKGLRFIPKNWGCMQGLRAVFYSNSSFSSLIRHVSRM
ncbi:MAG: hypothetical protein ACI9OH_003611, partial [Oleispira sp.]